MPSFRQSVRYASRGIAWFLAHERNGRYQAFIGFAAIMLGAALHISRLEWAAILGCMALVLALEMINSAIELLCNHLHPGFHPAIGIVKDLCAGAVWLASLFSVIIGACIFVPRIWALIEVGTPFST